MIFGILAYFFLLFLKEITKRPKIKPRMYHSRSYKQHSRAYRLKHWKP